MKKISCNEDQGFTFVEILVAMTIFAIGLLAVSRMQNLAVLGNGSSNKTMYNLNMGSLCVERFMMLPYDDPMLSEGLHEGVSQASDGIDNDLDGQVDEAAETGNISVNWLVQLDHPVKDTKTVTVSIACDGFKCKTLSLNFVKPRVM